MTDPAGSRLFSLASLPESEGTLANHRRALYGTDGSGWIVVRSAVSPTTLAQLQRTWTAPPSESFAPPVPNTEAGPGAPMFRADGPFSQTSHVWGPWNPPVDPALRAVEWGIQLLRNRLQGRPPWFGLSDLENGWIQTRVVRTLDGEGFVRDHADYAEAPPATPLGQHRFDPTMLQATLLLSTRDTDWTGEGFWLRPTEAGPPLPLAAPPYAQAGDLLLWRHSLVHGVGEVRTPPDSLGFLRVLIPQVIPGPR